MHKRLLSAAGNTRRLPRGDNQSRSHLINGCDGKPTRTSGAKAPGLPALVMSRLMVRLRSPREPRPTKTIYEIASSQVRQCDLSKAAGPHAVTAPTSSSIPPSRPGPRAPYRGVESVRPKATCSPSVSAKVSGQRDSAAANLDGGGTIRVAVGHPGKSRPRLVW